MIDIEKQVAYWRDGAQEGGERQWQEDDSSPIIEVARREGEYTAL